MSAPRRAGGGARRALRGAGAAALVVVAAFVLLEGGSSLVLFVRDLAAGDGARPLARLRHTRYDPDLGWAHVPNVHVPDLYGPGAGLRTNGQGCRAARDFAREVPPGRLRVVCSGDSFTLGYGVGDADPWCAGLEAIDARLETVNMGQGGYGVDQSYLWYRRDGRALDHDVHVFAFILDDFRRMQERSFLGYPKPVLALRGGGLVAENTPVPRRPFWAGFVPPLARAAASLRAAELARGARPAARGGDDAEVTALPEADPATFALVAKVVEDLAAWNREKASELVLVFLPTPADYRRRAADPWRRLAAREAAARGVAYLDLVEALRALPAPALEPLFIRPGALAFRAAAGHPTPEGHGWLARRVYEAIAARPRVAERLRRLPAPAGAAPASARAPAEETRTAPAAGVSVPRR